LDGKPSAGHSGWPQAGSSPGLAWGPAPGPSPGRPKHPDSSLGSGPALCPGPSPVRIPAQDRAGRQKGWCWGVGCQPAWLVYSMLDNRRFQSILTPMLFGSTGPRPSGRVTICS